MTPGTGQDQPVLIAGGGIGGLSAALALAVQGVASHVFEANSEFSESGAGIQIGPNGSDILRKWGLGDALERLAAKPDVLTIGDGPTGRQLAEIPLGATAEARYGSPYYVVERAVLHRLLREEAERRPEIALTTNFRLLSFRETGGGVAVMSGDGREMPGGALIGADGVHSQTRMLLFGRGPRPSGRKAWRATAPVTSSGAPNRNLVQLWLGARAHLVHYRCGPDGPLNAVAITRGTADAENWSSTGEAYDLKPQFADWDEEPYELLQQFESWKCWPLLAMDPLPQWSDGRVTLLGDAAHPIMPFLASGAVMAIEDAAILAAEFVRVPGDPAKAFRTYEARRRGRLARVRRGAAQMGAVYHMGGLMRFARNATLSLATGESLLARNDWLYGYCAEF